MKHRIGARPLQSLEAVAIQQKRSNDYALGTGRGWMVQNVMFILFAARQDDVEVPACLGMKQAIRLSERGRVNP
jgi:hypothetical protein